MLGKAEQVAAVNTREQPDSYAVLTSSSSETHCPQNNQYHACAKFSSSNPCFHGKKIKKKKKEEDKSELR